MAQEVLIDGNNLLHALPVHAPAPAVGRETLVRLVERWAVQSGHSPGAVTLVFDGHSPRPGLARQMSSTQISVQFSKSVSADDVIVALIQNAARPNELHVVTSDSAILHEARRRRCPCTDSARFSCELIAGPPSPVSHGERSPEKPQTIPDSEIEKWLDEFGLDDEPGSDLLDWRTG